MYKFGYPMKKRFSINYLHFFELIGVIAGIIGSFIVANNYGAMGYPVFFTSSVLLFATAVYQKNPRLAFMQFIFMLANINGLYTFLVK